LSHGGALSRAEKEQMMKVVATVNRANGKWGVMAQGLGRFVGPANLTKEQAEAKAREFNEKEQQ
jgi:hypothetical protein